MSDQNTSIPDNISELPHGNTPVEQDLYRHINGEWLGTHEIPADRPIDGTFLTLRDRAEDDVREIVERAGSTSSAEESSTAGTRRIGALYRSFMDEEGIEAAGLRALDADLDPIRKATDLSAFADALGALEITGVPGVTGYFVEKDSTQDIVRAYLVQSGLGLPDEAYYREDQHAPIREAYVDYLGKALALAVDKGQELPGKFAGEDATAAAKAVMAFETELAAGHWDNVSSRDAEKTYNPTPVGELPTGFPFAQWLNRTGVGAEQTIVVSQPSFLEHVAEMAEKQDLDTWKLWAFARVLHARATVAGEELNDVHFAFYGRTLSGSCLLYTSPSPRD